VHSLRHPRLGKVLLLHGSFDVPGENTFDGGRSNFLVDARGASYRRMIRYSFSSCVSSFFPFERQVDLVWRSVLGFFDEAMKQHNAAPLCAEENSRNSADALQSNADLSVASTLTISL